MSYTEKFLKSRGQNCIIERTVPVDTKVSINRSTNSTRDLGMREAYWQGLILYDSNLKSGEIINIRNVKYLVQTVDFDHSSKECVFFCTKCNAIIQHQRYVEDVDENFNVIKEWQTINFDVNCYGEIATYRLRQVDPGLLDSTKYVFQVPKMLGIKKLDRFIYNEEKIKVDSIDDIGLEGVWRCQLSPDMRAD